MARRRRRGDTSAIWARFRRQTETVERSLDSSALRSRVRVLVELHYLLRDVGSSLITVEGSDAGRTRILEYLKVNVGEIVAGAELMVVSGIDDYPRRIRELRNEYGWKILSGVTAKQITRDVEEADLGYDKTSNMKPDDYLLLSDVPDLDSAERWKTANTIRRSKKAVMTKVLDYLRSHVGQEISGEELKYVANGSGDWPRRVRQLRTEGGWPIATKQTGRPELPVGTYLLEADHQVPAHDRNIPDKIRAAAFKRDDYKCQGTLGDVSPCGWHHGLWRREDPRFLELHHVHHHAKGGSNEIDNLTTLCNLCHDEVHRRERLPET